MRHLPVVDISCDTHSMRQRYGLANLAEGRIEAHCNLLLSLCVRNAFFRTLSADHTRGSVFFVKNFGAEYLHLHVDYAHFFASLCAFCTMLSYVLLVISSGSRQSVLSSPVCTFGDFSAIAQFVEGHHSHRLFGRSAYQSARSGMHAYAPWQVAPCMEQ